MNWQPSRIFQQVDDFNFFTNNQQTVGVIFLKMTIYSHKYTFAFVTNAFVTFTVTNAHFCTPVTPGVAEVHEQVLLRGKLFYKLSI